jgi:hypothetical protein
MEMFGNPITGYTTEYYSKLIEKMSQGENSPAYHKMDNNKHSTNNQQNKRNLYTRMQDK